MNRSQNELVIPGFVYDWQRKERSLNSNKSLGTKTFLNLIKGILVNTFKEKKKCWWGQGEKLVQTLEF